MASAFDYNPRLTARQLRDRMVVKRGVVQRQHESFGRI